MLLLILILAQEALPVQVPPGFTVERVAGPPHVERPIMAAFDDRGRLYVTDSAGVNLKGPELLKNPPHSLRRLEDTDGDGRFDTSTLFADKLVFPQGLLWHDGAVYTISPPSLWKLEDTDGDGACDRRTELITGLANTGVGDDAHGACLGPDGRVYFLPGRMAHNLKLPDGTPIRKAVGPWLMRIRPDGRDVEIVCGTQGNPVEVDWTPEGDFFIGGTFWAPESYGGGLRDSLIHGVEGGEYAVRDRTYNDRKRTGDFLPVLVPMNASAPSGLTFTRSGAFGAEYAGNLFCTYFNWRKVQRHVLERDGATFRSRNEDFAVFTHADSHPTDVLEDADGSLLVVDTGGWFLIGCPTSKIAKPQALGAIYRIRRTDHPKTEDPRGLKLNWDAPHLLLDDPRFAVRERAIHELAKRGEAPSKLLSHPSARVRLNAVWTHARIDGAEPRAALSDKDASVRQASAAVAGLHRDTQALDRLIEIVKTDTPPLRREAATAIGRIGDKKAVPAILDALRGPTDRYLEHALLYALIRIADREAMVAALRDPNPILRRAALIALDQMEGGNLTPELVMPLLDDGDAAIKIITARPAWVKEVRGLVLQWIGASRHDQLAGAIVAFSTDAAIQDIVALALRADATPADTRLALLQSMSRAPLERPPATWLAELRWSLDHADERVVRQATAAIRVLGAAHCDEALLAVARDTRRPIDLRVEALAARAAKLDAPLFKLLTSSLEKENPPLLRLSAAEALGRSPLDDGQLDALARSVAAAGPLEMPRLIGAFERSGKDAVGRKLLAALEKSPGLESLPGETLRRVLAGYPEEVRRAAEPLLKRLEADLEKQKARLAELEPLLKGGAAARGREVFFGRKAACMACHTVQSQGGRIGPDLSKIGAIRAPRDLLEAVVFPSSTFARGFESFLVRTHGGAIHDGILVRETPDAIFLFTADRQEKRIARAAVEEIKQSRVSIMPQGLDQQLTRDELRDLLAFLAALK